MRTRSVWFVTVVAAGLLALALTPAGGASSGRLASAGSDVPIWGFVVVGLVLVVGIALVVAGLLRRRRGSTADDAPHHSVDE